MWFNVVSLVVLMKQLAITRVSVNENIVFDYIGNLKVTCTEFMYVCKFLIAPKDRCNKLENKKTYY